MTFDERVRDWERRVEDIILEIDKETTDDGLRFCIDSTKVIREFNYMLADLRTDRKSHIRGKAVLKPELTTRED